ncbi:MAG: hypothetical protein MJZ73_03025 [Bacteroidaceae bacterium]|nr:hypothetical protein [Bacteroidaceae bacterium]
MELTKEKLANSGFKTNHEERVLPTYYCYSPKGQAEAWRIAVSSEYSPLTNSFSFSCEISKCNEKGAVIKRGSLTDIKTVEDLNGIIALCGIDLEVK